MRERDPYEIAKVGLPPLAAIVATILAIGALALWGVLLATQVPV